MGFKFSSTNKNHKSVTTKCFFGFLVDIVSLAFQCSSSLFVLSDEVNSNEVLDQIEFNIRGAHIRWIIWYVVSGYTGRTETYILIVSWGFYCFNEKKRLLYVCTGDTNASTGLPTESHFNGGIIAGTTCQVSFLKHYIAWHIVWNQSFWSCR